MTTPNIDELIDRLYDWHNPSAEQNRLDMQKDADLLQSQAERIAELEVIVASYGELDVEQAKHIACMESDLDTLRIELEAIAATEPVAEVGGTFTLYWVGSGPIEPIVKKYGIKVGDKLFTRPMPAQDVTELVEALEMIVSTHQGHCEHHVGVSKHSYNLANIAEEALSKYKGVK